MHYINLHFTYLLTYSLLVYNSCQSCNLKSVTLFACSLLCTFYYKNLQFLLSHPEAHNHYVSHTVSPTVGAGI